MDSGEAIGQGIGRVLIPVVLMLWGMHRCRQLAETPRVNPFSTRGLMYSLGAWVLLLLHSAFAPMLAWPLTLAALASVAGLGIVGTIQSLRGLSGWNDYAGGNVHGVFGLLIGAGLPVLILVGFLRGFVRA